jgi:glutaminase
MTSGADEAAANAATGPCYISTGHLPDAEQVTAMVQRAWHRFKDNADGRNSDV